ncbi:MAG TPA: porin [Candidatus Eisenbacteria bacterium]
MVRRAMLALLFLATTPFLASAADDPAVDPAATDKPRMPGSVYDKPFLYRGGDGNFMVGGYLDLELHANESTSTFTAHRFVPFIYGQISDRVSVASEIEFEYGGAVAGDEETDGEIKVEFAHMDFRMTDAFQFRGGILLSPLGRFNLVHDSAVNDLTERPLVDQQIIPSTLSEAGLGFFGTIETGESSLLSYEAYLVNGFNQGILEENGEIRNREGRGSAKTDNNNARSFVGRLGFSPMLGLDLGASAHTGRYTDRTSSSENLSIVAFDARFNRGPLELLGEYALSGAGLPDGITLEGADEVNQNGYYVQANWHFLSGTIKSMPASIMTAVVRFDEVDFDTDITGDRNRRFAVGLNFRPTEDTAFKADVTRGWRADRGVEGDGLPQDSAHFSVATYF